MKVTVEFEMNCEEFQKQLDSVVESKGIPTDALREHGTQCSEQVCQSRWQEYLLLERLLGPWKSNVPSIDFTSIVRKSLKQADVSVAATPRVSILPEQDSTPRRRSHFAVLASFAGVAMLLIALFSSLQSPTDKRVANHGSTPALPVGPGGAEVVQVAESDEQALQEISSKCVGWMEGATHRLSDAVTYVIKPANSPMDAMPPMRDPAEWLKTWGERLEPIEDSLDRTLRQLLEDSANPMGSPGDRTT